MNSLLGEPQVERTLGGVLTQKKFYLQQVRSKRLVFKALTPQVGVRGFLLFGVRLSIEKGEFCHPM